MKLPGDSVVPTKISGLDAKPVRIAPGAAVQKRQEQSAGATASASESGSDVQLTGASRHLAAIEQQLKTLPAVDELRVAMVKQRLESGDYQVDPQRIADKLLRIESELGRGSPLEKNILK